MSHSSKLVQAARQGTAEVRIHVGGIYVSRTPVWITTLLGSCISVCLFDPSTRIGGMNHFLLPGELNAPELSTKYGINAMEILINEMMKLGATRFRLLAKVFGGANIFRTNHNLMMVGERNVKFIREFLGTENIPVISERLGGDEGLIVHYLANSFEVFVKPIATDRFSLHQEEEARFYSQVTGDLRARDSSNVTLF
jgi:chemotaxis protein CheD